MAKKRNEELSTLQQIDSLLNKASEQFRNGKKAVIIKLPNSSKEFFNEFKTRAHDQYSFTVTKKLFNKVKISKGIVYEYPF